MLWHLGPYRQAQASPIPRDSTQLTPRLAFQMSSHQSSAHTPRTSFNQALQLWPLPSALITLRPGTRQLGKAPPVQTLLKWFPLTKPKPAHAVTCYFPQKPQQRLLPRPPPSASWWAPELLPAARGVTVFPFSWELSFNGSISWSVGRNQIIRTPIKTGSHAFILNLYILAMQYIWESVFLSNVNTYLAPTDSKTTPEYINSSGEAYFLHTWSLWQMVL